MMSHVLLAQPCNTIQATNRAAFLTPAQVVLETGAHTSVVKNKQLLLRIHQTRTKLKIMIVTQISYKIKNKQLEVG